MKRAAVAAILWLVGSGVAQADMNQALTGGEIALIVQDAQHAHLSEQATLSAAMHYQEHESGYSKQQSTRPQTLAYGLADSPSGQMAWIIEKYAQWTDCVQNNVRHPENAVERDVLLDIATHYWMTNSGGSSAKLYWESFTQPDYRPIDQPMGISLFPKELFLCILGKVLNHLG